MEVEEHGRRPRGVNAGSLTQSVVMGRADWQAIAQPRVLAFTR